MRAHRQPKIEYLTTETSKRKNPRGNVFHGALFRSAEQGSLTVEAAMAFPLVLVLVLSLFQVFGAVVFANKLQSAIGNVGRRLSYYYYAVEEIKGEEERSLVSSLAEGVVFLAASETVIKGLVMEDLKGERNPSNLVKGGREGISFVLSHYNPKEERIYVTARYEIKIPFLEWMDLTIPVVQGTVHRVWTGRAMPEGTNEELVYVTENSKVYHTHLSCGSLSLRVKEIPKANLSAARNASGEIYRACEFCGNGSGDKVFVSVYGNRYHFDRNCSGLKRTVMTIRMSEVGDRTLCKRCAARSGQ